MSYLPSPCQPWVCGRAQRKGRDRQSGEGRDLGSHDKVCVLRPHSEKNRDRTSSRRQGSRLVTEDTPAPASHNVHSGLEKTATDGRRTEQGRGEGQEGCKEAQGLPGKLGEGQSHSLSKEYRSKWGRSGRFRPGTCDEPALHPNRDT